MLINIDKYQYKGDPVMSRIQIALNVSNVDAAVAFYSQLLGTDPAKRRPGYANFAVAEPPLKLVLIENPSEAGSLNHLGVEVETSAKVSEAIARFKQAGLETQVEEQVTCCYAVQDKVWVTDADGTPWEIYTVLGDSATRDQAQAKESSEVCSNARCA